MAKRRAAVESAPPWVVLRTPLTRAGRAAVSRQVRALLAWQVSMKKWPRAGRAPDATPFVSVYARGVLRGCFGCHEGGPGERLTRGFLRALEDSRYGLVRPEERDALDVVVSYVDALRPVRADAIESLLEPGTDGLALTRPGQPPVVLLPSVARDLRIGATELLELLRRKAGEHDPATAEFFALRTEDVVVRSHEPVERLPRDPRRLALRWLERLVGDDGTVTFAIDARRRARIPAGTMHHGRAAVLVRALREGRSPLAGRAMRWLERSLAAGLQGRRPTAWPDTPAMVAGTLALAHLAGARVDEPLRSAATWPELLSSPWHAAQVVAALGGGAPARLWKACVDDLGARPWAPWTLLAARAREDGPTVERVARAVAASLRTASPHPGGCQQTRVPELAVTALALESLAGLPDAASRAAVRRGRQFVAAHQLLPGAIPGSLDPSLAVGAFPVSPVVVDYLRCDVGAHALLALVGRTSRGASRVDENETTSPGAAAYGAPQT